MRTVAIILLSAAVLAACDPLLKTQVVSGYCEQYRRSITTKAEALTLQVVPRSLKERIIANETTYRCLCTDWKNPVCQNDAIKK